MKKILALAAVAMLAIGAQAESFNVQYNVNIQKCEDSGVGKNGTIPNEVVVTLVDTGYNDATLYARTIKFGELTGKYNDSMGAEQTIYLGDYLDDDGRFKIKALVDKIGQKTLTVDFGKDAQADEQYLKLSYNEGQGYVAQLGMNLEYGKTWAGANSYYGRDATEDEKAAYANENLVTVLKSSGKEYELQVGAIYDTSLNSRSKLKDLQPTPEPTSGVLLVMGLAGLALKRKRVA